MRTQSWKPLYLVFGISAVFFVIFVTATFLFFAKGGRGGSGSSKRPFAESAVGLVELNGVIMDSKRTLKTLERFAEADDVKAIVVRINSPGGAVAPSQEIYQAVKNSKKPIIASMSSVAASGGYYVAVGTQKIYANPGTITGSIGVIMEFMNLEKLYDWAKVKRYSIKTGKYKDAGAEYREMAPDERALLQGMVDDVLKQFVAAVSEGRKLSAETVTAVADGRIFSGSQAHAAKLVDELGSLDDAIAEAGRLGKIEGKPRVLTDEKKHDFWSMLEELQGGSDEESSSSHWTEKLVAAFTRRVPGATQATPLPAGIYWLWRGGY